MRREEIAADIRSAPGDVLDQLADRLPLPDLPWTGKVDEEQG